MRRRSGFSLTFRSYSDAIQTFPSSTGTETVPCFASVEPKATRQLADRDRLVGAIEKTSGASVLAQVTYIYDALDRRISMDENGTQTWTLYDPATSNPIMDFNGSGRER
jgi:hypothetical protein